MVSKKQNGKSISIWKKNSPIKGKKLNFEGSSFDLENGFNYIMDKHNNIKILIPLNLKYSSYIGLLYYYEEELKKNKLIYLGKSLRKDIINNNKRFLVIPLTIFYPTGEQPFPHFNLIIIDMKKKVIERFEPYGSIVTLETHNKFDKDFKKFLIKKNMLKEFKYHNSKAISPYKSFQEIEEEEVKKGEASERSEDLHGYCTSWAIWFLDLKMKYPNIKSGDLMQKSLKKLTKKKKDKNDNLRSYRNFIRNYTYYLVKKRH